MELGILERNRHCLLMGGEGFLPISGMVLEHSEVEVGETEPGPGGVCDCSIIYFCKPYSV